MFPGFGADAPRSLSRKRVCCPNGFLWTSPGDSVSGRLAPWSLSLLYRSTTRPSNFRWSPKSAWKYKR